MTFKRALGRFDVTMIVIGGIIGSGIFINPYLVAQRLDSSVLVLAAWIVGGTIAVAGALSYAELGSLFPRVGGQYAYLRDAIHPMAGFLYGWAELAVIESGAVAAVAIVFATYTLRLVGHPDVSPIPLAIAALLILSLINVLGVKPGSRVLNVLVILKIGALVVLIVFGLFAPGTPGWSTIGKSTTLADTSSAIAFGAALVPILFAYGGWQNANYVAEEVEDPSRQLPVSIIGGTMAVVAIYVLVNVVYLRALGLEGLAATITPAADAARHMFGSLGDRFVTAAIAISTFGFLDLAILAPTRVYYAMAADGLFFPALARLHPTYRTPAAAIAVQTTWSCILALSGSYGQLLNYVVFADWIFFGLTVSTVLVFRRTVPVRQRPLMAFRAPGYPVVPALFVATAAAIVLSVVWADPESASRGALLLAAGIPLFYWFVTRKKKASSTLHPTL
ncbi:MAG TPA: amino acid permease [Vicinamibacterales bacterium]|nr:amino acid permease [Vicinamibacterales bacterium]